MPSPYADRWVVPTGATDLDHAPLSAEDVTLWRTAGYALVNSIIEPGLVNELAAFARSRVPEPSSSEAAGISNFGSGGRLTFPSTAASFNATTLHPRLLASVAQLLGTTVDNLRLTQSDLWPKYGRATVGTSPNDNADQRIHVDYPNHTIVHPPAWDQPAAVEMILYLSEVDECGGPTAVVPRAGDEDPAYRYPIVDTPGVGELPYINDRQSAESWLGDARPDIRSWREALYAREQYARYQTGTILLYRHDTWHRGTPMVPGTLRLAHNLTFRRADAEWISTLHVGWSWAMYRQDKMMEKLVASLSVDQRAVLGFPPPGSSYWTPDTVNAVAARYAPFGLDVTPYANALASPGAE